MIQLSLKSQISLEIFQVAVNLTKFLPTKILQNLNLQISTLSVTHEHTYGIEPFQNILTIFYL